MTPHFPTPDPFPLPPEWLAAYADGELDAEARAAVERWLVDHPEALDDLNAQRAFSPANAALWEQVEPPEPSPAAWAAARRRIENELAPQAGREFRSRAANGLVVACAAVVAALLGVGMLAHRLAQQPVAPRPGPVVPVEVAKAPTPEVAPAPRAVVPQRPDPLAEFAVLPIATDDDVVLERVPDTGAGWLPVGRHPLPGELVLAAPDEVTLQDVDPSPAWPTGRPKMTTAPGDAPMLFALIRR